MYLPAEGQNFLLFFFPPPASSVRFSSSRLRSAISSVVSGSSAGSAGAFCMGSSFLLVEWDGRAAEGEGDGEGESVASRSS